MPERSRFYGIVIKMYFGDHDPPHFHAEYAEDRAVINIDTLAVLGGRLPPRALGLVAEWAALHQEELRQAWQKAKKLEPAGKIAPLP
ncbi:MAG: transcriptional regulator [Acidobacteria bacterium RIFCSPLOWO2_02_FULL_68_18]|nr:MAG: transcriptional regulator [Acidobacteria bacterium RIFCSPLOWO2_02_FULL_68_18]OFW50738.1 MAG: transcriptional regulator [Acidobacteria bacterium RIFCSPLOWO2_12_FULL_68_19]